MKRLVNLSHFWIGWSKQIRSGKRPRTKQNLLIWFGTVVEQKRRWWWKSWRKEKLSAVTPTQKKFIIKIASRKLWNFQWKVSLKSLILSHRLLSQGLAIAKKTKDLNLTRRDIQRQRSLQNPKTVSRARELLCSKSGMSYRIVFYRRTSWCRDTSTIHFYWMGSNSIWGCI